VPMEAQVAMALPPPVPPPQAPRGGFHLVPVANAEPVPERRGGSRTGSWAIQIGAFSKPAQAQEAIGMARIHSGESLAVAHPMVASVHEKSATLYRARLTGLSREAAVADWAFAAGVVFRVLSGRDPSPYRVGGHDRRSGSFRLWQSDLMQAATGQRIASIAPR
jgi:hypothetical protein